MSFSVAITCPPLSKPENGARFGKNLFGSSIKYYCYDGYKLVGSEERMCSENQTWTGTEPRCERKQPKNIFSWKNLWFALLTFLRGRHYYSILLSISSILFFLASVPTILMISVNTKKLVIPYWPRIDNEDPQPSHNASWYFNIE